MKVKVLLLIVTVASLLAALACATGIIIQRGGGPGPQGQGIIPARGVPQATGAIVQGPRPRV